MHRQRIIMTIAATALALVAIVGLGLAGSRSGRAEEEQPLLEYPTYAPTPTIGAVPTSPPQLNSQSLFVDTFDDANSLSKWEALAPADLLPEDKPIWTIEDGALLQSRTGLNDPSTVETMLVTGQSDWANYTVSTKVYDTKNSTFGLVARRQGDSYYRYRIIANVYEATPKQVLEKVVDGTATTLVSLDSPGYDQRQWHTVSMTVNGSDISVTLDGQVVAKATDSTLTSGQAGVYTRAMGDIRFDEVTITQP